MAFTAVLHLSRFLHNAWASCEMSLLLKCYCGPDLVDFKWKIDVAVIIKFKACFSFWSLTQGNWELIALLIATNSFI